MREGGTVNRYIFKLYVTGKTIRSERAEANLREACEGLMKGKHDIHVIDVLENPQLAESAKILATPTLVKEFPPPLRRIVGDLSKTEDIQLEFDIEASGKAGEW